MRTAGIGIAARLAAAALALGLIGGYSPPLEAAPQVIAPTGTPLTLDVGKGLILRFERPCSSVFVADPNTADVQLKSPTVLYIFGKAAGETTVYAVDQKDNVLLDSRVEVRQDVDRLERDIRAIDPHSNVEAKAVDDSIVLEGTITSAAEGDDIRKIAARYVAKPDQLVNKLTLDAPNQIDLQVRIAEVNRTVLKQFGINWANLGQNNPTAPIFGMVSGNASLSGALSTSTAPGANHLGLNVPNTTLLGNAINNNIFVGGQRVNALIDALANDGLITILAEPNLVTVSGKTASFLAGGEFPVPVPQSGVGTTAVITIDWKKFGVSLNFTPTILANDRIALHVAPEVSELAPQQGITVQGVSVPGITTRRADTTVELGSGQSFAIAGLLQNQTQQQVNAYPWIEDIPIIGALFRSTAFQRGETELVIIVTPYLVQPVSSATALRTGVDGFYAPSDKERVLDGALNTVPKPHAPPVNDPAPAAVPAAGSGSAAPFSAAAGYEID